MRGLVAAFCLLVLAAPAAAQDWRMAPEYDILLTRWDIDPGEIRLKAGEPVRLRFVNNTPQALSFSAERFFRASKLRNRDGAAVKGGELDVPPLSTVTVVLVPKAGRYRVDGGSLFHRLLGMSGSIIVE
jgi:hypothetical protein